MTDKKLIKGQLRISGLSTEYSSNEENKTFDISTFEETPKMWNIKKKKQVSFSEKLVNVVDVENWKSENFDCSLYKSVWGKEPKRDKRKRKKKDQIKCECLIA